MTEDKDRPIETLHGGEGQPADEDVTLPRHAPDEDDDANGGVAREPGGTRGNIEALHDAKHVPADEELKLPRHELEP